LQSKGVAHEASRDLAFGGRSLFAGGLLQLLQPSIVARAVMHNAAVVIRHAAVVIRHAGVALRDGLLSGDVVLRHAAGQQRPIHGAISDRAFGRFAGRRRPVPGRRR